MGVLDRVRGAFSNRGNEGNAGNEFSSVDNGNSDRSVKFDGKSSGLEEMEIDYDYMRRLLRAFLNVKFGINVELYNMKFHLIRAEYRGYDENKNILVDLSYRIYGNDEAFDVSQTLKLTDLYEGKFMGDGLADVSLIGEWVEYFTPQEDVLSYKNINLKETVVKSMEEYKNRFSKESKRDRLTKYLEDTKVDNDYRRRMARIVNHLPRTGLKIKSETKGEYKVVLVNVCKGMEMAVTPNIVYHIKSQTIVYDGKTDSNQMLIGKMKYIAKENNIKGKEYDEIMSFVEAYITAIDLRKRV